MRGHSFSWLVTTQTDAGLSASSDMSCLTGLWEPKVRSYRNYHTHGVAPSAVALCKVTGNPKEPYS